jgi:methylmalonyl-CoA/ethylmalonyl-CoA epimerase
MELDPRLVIGIDHVGIAVFDLDATVAAAANRFGLAEVSRHRVPAQGVEEVMLPVGESFIQFLCPLGPDTTVARFLERRGEGMHHLAYRVRDLAACLEALDRDGVRLIDHEPRIGSEPGVSIAFVHPEGNAGTLIELVERPNA